MATGFPGGAVFRGAPPLDQVVGLVAGPALIHDVVDFILIRGTACNISGFIPSALMENNVSRKVNGIYENIIKGSSLAMRIWWKPAYKSRVEESGRVGYSLRSNKLSLLPTARLREQRFD
ncbi:hypothetical protein, conserved [Eimeria brunetti]|uniref:Uncharacterized protein n=1 Tax=Eimeria brunetti TaxID=51314 RepID=U6LU91_9EIME|nr:hypothetical protein, conserved [Eimeria brunetti]